MISWIKDLLYPEEPEYEVVIEDARTSVTESGEIEVSINKRPVPQNMAAMRKPGVPCETVVRFDTMQEVREELDEEVLEHIDTSQRQLDEWGE